jgi:hypothetical protein
MARNKSACCSVVIGTFFAPLHRYLYHIPFPMKKILFALFALFAIAVTPAAAQQNRTVAVPQPAAYFQTRLERLYQSINNKDQTAVARYERELMGAMREAIEEVGTPAAGSTDARFKQEMGVILQKFENFTFVNATKDDSDEHLALLESFLAMMIK